MRISHTLSYKHLRNSDQCKMAAPIDHKEAAGEELNISSSQFDPRQALYSPKITVPSPGVKPFNNLAEYESFMKRKDAESQKQGKMEPIKLPGIIAQKAAEQARENVRIAALKAQASMRPVPNRKEIRTSTVLTKMEERFEKGPLNILKRSMKERLKVVVVIRAAVTVRSHCKGFIIAFDKHMNMAMMDVDEIFLKPVCKEEKTNKTAKLADKQNAEGEKHKTSESVPTSSTVSMDVSDRGGIHRDSNSRDTLDKKEQVLNVQNLSSVKLESSESPEDDSVVSGERVSVSKLTKQMASFWPVYKDWVSNRSYGHYEVVTRHINQLFIRGDNVVSVSIIPDSLVPPK